MRRLWRHTGGSLAEKSQETPYTNGGLSVILKIDFMRLWHAAKRNDRDAHKVLRIISGCPRGEEMAHLCYLQCVCIANQWCALLRRFIFF